MTDDSEVIVRLERILREVLTDADADAARVVDGGTGTVVAAVGERLDDLTALFAPNGGPPPKAGDLVVPTPGAVHVLRGLAGPFVHVRLATGADVAAARRVLADPNLHAAVRAGTTSRVAEADASGPQRGVRPAPGPRPAPFARKSVSPCAARGSLAARALAECAEESTSGSEAPVPTSRVPASTRRPAPRRSVSAALRGSRPEPRRTAPPAVTPLAAPVLLPPAPVASAPAAGPELAPPAGPTLAARPGPGPTAPVRPTPAPPALAAPTPPAGPELVRSASPPSAPVPSAPSASVRPAPAPNAPARPAPAPPAPAPPVPTSLGAPGDAAPQRDDDAERPPRPFRRATSVTVADLTRGALPAFARMGTPAGRASLGSLAVRALGTDDGPVVDTAAWSCDVTTLSRLLDGLRRMA